MTRSAGALILVWTLVASTAFADQIDDGDLPRRVFVDEILPLLTTGEVDALQGFETVIARRGIPDSHCAAGSPAYFDIERKQIVVCASAVWYLTSLALHSQLFNAWVFQAGPKREFGEKLDTAVRRYLALESSWNNVAPTLRKPLENDCEIVDFSYEYWRLVSGATEVLVCNQGDRTGTTKAAMVWLRSEGGPLAAWKEIGGTNLSTAEIESRLRLLAADVARMSLFFVIGHEIGHIVLGIPEAASPSSENRADSFALNLRKREGSKYRTAFLFNTAATNVFAYTIGQYQNVGIPKPVDPFLARMSLFLALSGEDIGGVRVENLGLNPDAAARISEYRKFWANAVKEMLPSPTLPTIACDTSVRKCP